MQNDLEQLRAYIDQKFNDIDSRFRLHSHKGIETPRVNFFDIFGLVDTVSTAPTGKPKSPSEQFRIYSAGSTVAFYWYDSVNGVWRTTGSGVYTPTRSAESNLDSNVTMTEAQWMQVGNTVTVSGRFTADPTTTATDTSFEITLPIASNIGAAEDVAGTAFCGAIVSQGAAVIGVVANDTAKVIWKAGDITSQVWSYVFQYQVI